MDLGLALLDRKPNIEIRKRMDVDLSILDTVNSKRLRWYGHVCCMGTNPKTIISMYGIHALERRERWKDDMRMAMKEENLQHDFWVNRGRWNKRL